MRIDIWISNETRVQFQADLTRDVNECEWRNASARDSIGGCVRRGY